ncbi:MAG TPA: hypothetical protein VNU45_18000 [Rummeliibacillus sp.]|nr:hypothetical protein [Rummeliibacillus sp.]
MNKYQIGQQLYWIKYVGNVPELQRLVAQVIKQSFDGYKYSEGIGHSYIKEDLCFDSSFKAVENGCELLRRLL